MRDPRCRDLALPAGPAGRTTSRREHRRAGADVKIRERSGFSVVWLVTVLSIVATLLVGSALASSGPPAILTPSDGIYLGAFSGPRAGETRQQAFTRVEHELGRDLAIDHEYYKWDSAFPTSQETWAVGHGSIPFINWKAERSDGSVVRWSRIASGAEDAVIDARADALKAFGAPVYLTFHHEPENDLAGWGTPGDYAAAFRHVVDVFRNRGVTNVGWVWNMMTWTFDPRSGRDPSAFYPGDAYVDFIGADGYNWYPSKPSWESFLTVFSLTNAWAVAHGKPWMVVETGVQEDPNVAGRKGDWFRDVAATAKAWPALKAFIYFDVAKQEDGTVHHWESDSSSSSVQGFAALGANSYFQPGGSGPGPSPSPTPGPSPSPTPGPSSDAPSSPSTASSTESASSPSPDPSSSPSAVPSIQPAASQSPVKPGQGTLHRKGKKGPSPTPSSTPTPEG